jgi:hypothetical protein
LNHLTPAQHDLPNRYRLPGRETLADKNFLNPYSVQEPDGASSCGASELERGGGSPGF